MVVTHLTVKSCHGFLSSANFLLEKCYCFWLLYKLTVFPNENKLSWTKVCRSWKEDYSPLWSLQIYSWVGRRLRSFELENRFEDILSGSISSFAGSVPPAEELFSKYYCYKHSLYKYYKKLQAIFHRKAHYLSLFLIVMSSYLSIFATHPRNAFEKVCKMDYS